MQAQAAFRMFTSVETQNNLNPVNLVTYPNDFIGVRLSYNLTCSNNTITIIPLRFISLNGTFNIVNLNYTLPPVNYCPTNLTNTTSSDKINIFTLPDNFLLIRHWRLLDGSSNMVEYYGLITSNLGFITN
ncbi:3622_t:CDS:2, partial [Scutellospora calospora]